MNTRQSFQPDPDEVFRGTEKIIDAFKELPSLLTDLKPNFTWRNQLYGLSPAIVEDIAIRVEKDKERFRYFHGSDEPEAAKVGGNFMYWIAKRRPIYFPYVQQSYTPLSDDEFSLNEYLAVFTGLNRTISSTFKPEELEVMNHLPLLNRVLRDLIYTLRYRQYSSDDLFIMLKMVTSH